MNNEIYSVDINQSSNHILYGGGNHAAEVYDYKEDLPVTKVEDFDDSVLYVKFLENGNFIVVTIDGTVALMNLKEDINVFSVGEDLSVAYFNEKLILGAISGKVYLYDADLEHINTFGGHEEEIISVDYSDGKVYSLCTSRFMVHDEYGREIVSYRAPEATAMKHISGDVVCTAQEKKLTISKHKTKLFEYVAEGSIETMEFMNKILVVGGDFEHILLIETSRYYSICKLDIKLRVNKIKAYDENTIIFSTFCGLIGMLDIRNIKTLKIFDSGVETVFDFAFSGNTVIAGGETGIQLIDLKSEPLELKFDEDKNLKDIDQ